MSTRVGVLRGGPSDEFSVSLKTGAAVLKNLPEKYQGIDILIDRERVWHEGGMPISPEKLFSRIDVFFNALHGAYGEDGKLARFFETYQVPFTGSGSLASAIGMHKGFTKARALAIGVRVPHGFVVKKEQGSTYAVHRAWREISGTIIVKPARGGSSRGVTIIKQRDNLSAALANLFEQYDELLIEEYIRGKEATVGVIENFRGENLYTLLPAVPVTIGNGEFFDTTTKYDNTLHHYEFRDHLSHQESETLAEAAKAVHQEIGARHYSRHDFIVKKNGSVYFLEINTLPGLTEASSFPLALREIGSTFSNFLNHVITLALER